MTARRIETLAEDVKAGRLPQVCWILPPAAFSEHPHFTPAYGAAYTARILDALTANPAVWSKTVLLIMYDENDGLFDHVVPPQPPTPVLPGKSTVSTAGEIHDVVNPAHLPLYTADQLPYGLGPRVPMTVVSPWSKGGFVCSQVFDHTSVIRFIEARFGVVEPNITPWRRAICGDLTSAFDFSKPDAMLPPLPDTSGYRAMADEQCRLPDPPLVPATANGIVPQEPGTKPARPLPYHLHVDGLADESAGTFALRFRNEGSQGAHFYVYSSSPDGGPRRYTVEAHKELTDTWSSGSHDYALAVYGPNGFFRRFAGRAVDQSLAVLTRYDPSSGDLLLSLTNPGSLSIACYVTDGVYGRAARHHRLAPGQTHVDRWTLSGSERWYDLTVSIDGKSGWSQRFAGHIETGNPSTTDPAATAPVLTIA